MQVEAIRRTAPNQYTVDITTGSAAPTSFVFVVELAGGLPVVTWSDAFEDQVPTMRSREAQPILAAVLAFHHAAH